MPERHIPLNAHELAWLQEMLSTRPSPGSKGEQPEVLGDMGVVPEEWGRKAGMDPPPQVLYQEDWKGKPVEPRVPRNLLPYATPLPTNVEKLPPQVNQSQRSVNRTSLPQTLTPGLTRPPDPPFGEEELLEMEYMGDPEGRRTLVTPQMKAREQEQLRQLMEMERYVKPLTYHDIYRKIPQAVIPLEF
jgi:hypothetical protein